MARNRSGPTFEQRVTAALTPQQRDNAAATLLLAGLVDELCDLIAQQTDRLGQQNARLDEQNNLLDDIRNGRRGERATPDSGNAKGRTGGADMRITEPDTPPPDNDDQGDADSVASVAEPAAGGTPARSTPTTPAPRTPTPAKKATAAAAPRRQGRTTGKG